MRSILSITMIITLALFAPCSLAAQEDIPTVTVSTNQTVHLVFPENIVYFDLGDNNILAEIIPSIANVVRVKAAVEFTNQPSLYVVTETGKSYPFKIIFSSNTLDRFTYDYRGVSSSSVALSSSKGVTTGDSVFSLPSEEAPQSSNPMVTIDEMTTTAKRIIDNNRKVLSHIGMTAGRVDLLCERIVVHKEKVYITIWLKNRSNISYTAETINFFIEEESNVKRTVPTQREVIPIFTYGKISSVKGKASKMVFVFDKLTLERSSVLRAYVYERDGYRNLSLSITAKDLSHAQSL